MAVKYPQVHVKLVGEDGNAFDILGRCSSAAKKAGLTPAQIKEFNDEATSSDYGHLLRTAMSYFSCDNDEHDDYR